MSFPSFGEIIDWLNPFHHGSAPGTAPPATGPAPEAPAQAPEPAPGMGGLAPEAPVAKPKGSDLVYLGINDPVRKAEEKALPEGATAIDGQEDPAKQGTFKDKDGNFVKLDNQKNVDQFLKEAGVQAARKKADGSMESEEDVKKRVEALEQVFLGKKVNGKYAAGGGMAMGSRDEMAELIAHTQKVENGDAEMKRLIISGHHYMDEGGIHGDRGQISYAELGAVMNQFGKARDGVEELMFSACNTNNHGGAQKDIYQEIFPHLKSFTGYNTYAPSISYDPKAPNSSQAHIRDWSSSSQHNDPEEIKRMFPERETKNDDGTVSKERAGVRTYTY